MAREPRREGGAAYVVGFGKPPERTRFRKGRSGNPAGRPKGALNLGTLLGKVLAEKVAVKDASGRRREISKLEAALTQLVNKAAGADLRAIRLLVDLDRRQRADRAADGGGRGEGIPATPGVPGLPMDPSKLSTADLRILVEAGRIFDRELEPPAACPMPPSDPANPSGTADAPFRWYTPSPGDQTDDDGEAG
jgi:hypothetical protein